MTWLCLLLIAVSAAVSLPTTALLLRISRRAGFVDPVGAEPHKVHGRAVPNTGGVAIFWAVAIPLGAALLAAWLVPARWWEFAAPVAAIHVDGLRRSSVAGAGLLTGLLALHALGLLDDRRPLSAAVKLIVQLAVAAGLVLVAENRALAVLGAWWGPAGTFLSVAISVLWIVVIVNAFNMLDNMDGLSAGVAAICASMYLVSTLIAGQWFVAGLCALLVGALLGFLVFNLPPARIYMGDGGSLVVGLLVAMISVRTTYFAPDAGHLHRPGQWYGVLMPLMVLAIPLYDFVSVTVIRLIQGRRPWTGDHQHFSHRLLRMGLGRRGAVALIWLATLATGLGGAMLGTLTEWQAAIAACQTLAIVLVLALLEHGSARAQRSEVSGPTDAL